MTESLAIVYTGEEDALSAFDENTPFLTLVQEQPDKVDNNPSDNDLIAMYNYIVAGLSAHEYTNENCPVSFTSEGIKLTLGVHVNINPIDLEYVIYSNKGVLVGPSLNIGEEERAILIPMSDEMELGYIVDDLQISWETPCYNKQGDIISMPDYEVKGTKIVFPEPIFRAGWGKVKFRSHKYRAEITAYYDEDYTYIDGYGRTLTQEEAIREGIVTYINADFSTRITAKYFNLAGKEVVETLDLDIPDCVRSFLNVCLKKDRDNNTNTEFPNDNEGKVKVYIDTCDGSTLKIEEP